LLVEDDMKKGSTKFVTEKEVLPTYPRTLHLPWKPNAARGDLVADLKDCGVLFTSDFVSVDEKIDGANCGMVLLDGEPIIRNRDHILRKGYSKDTPAKQQFKSVWTWFYAHRDQFELLASVGPYSVYGDWMVAQHGLEYNKLPSLFMTYDLFDHDAGKWMDSHKAKEILTTCGFSTVPEVHRGSLDTWEQLEVLANQPSPFTDLGHREGLYVKVSDGRWVTHRFKMVRESFRQGALWSETEIKRNTVIKEGGDADRRSETQLHGEGLVQET
jgi:hypothetical protein